MWRGCRILDPLDTRLFNVVFGMLILLLSVPCIFTRLSPHLQRHLMLFYSNWKNSWFCGLTVTIEWGVCQTRRWQIVLVWLLPLIVHSATLQPSFQLPSLFYPITRLQCHIICWGNILCDSEILFPQGIFTVIIFINVIVNMHQPHMVRTRLSSFMS